MNASLQTTVNMPFNHYSLIYLDHMGRLQVQESPSISGQNMTIFSHEVREKFLEILGSQIGYRQPLIRSMCLQARVRRVKTPANVVQEPPASVPLL